MAPPIVGIKSSFAGGELAPSLRSRIDLALYSKGATTLKNVIVHPHGGASNRPGLHYIATEKTTAKKIRLIPFEFSTTQTYVLEFGDYYIRFYTDGAQVYDASSFDNYTKLVLHCDASPFTDEIGKTITNTTKFDSYVKLMLHCDGTDASTTFTDEIGKTVTAVGTAQLDTAQKKFGTASGLFDGDSDYLTLVDHADWNFGDGDFTLDFWIRPNSVATTQRIITQATDSNNGFTLYFDPTNGWIFVVYSGGSAAVDLEQGSLTMSAGTWYHIAMVRYGNKWTIYQDGVSVANIASNTTTMGNYTGTLQIGYDTTLVPNQYFNGWLDEVKISKGIARWTTAFTAPTAAYGSVSLDTSTKKFGAGSANFFNRMAYLSAADNADWNFGINDFTIDWWSNFADTTGKQGFASQYEDANNYWVLGKNADHTLYLQFKKSGNTLAYYYTTSAYSFSTATQYHFEFIRSGANAYIFVNGVSQSLTTGTSFGTSDMGDISATLVIGYDGANDVFLRGNIDEFRVSKGTARHTQDFTTSTAAYSTGTILEVTTPYPEADLFDLQYTQSADILYITHPDYAPRQLERNAATDWDLNLYAYEDGPFQLDNTDSTSTLAISATTGTGKTLTAAGFTFNTLHVGSLWKLRHYIEGQAVTVSLQSATASTSINCGGTWRLITHGTWTGTLRVQKSTDSGSTWTVLREFSSAADYNADTSGTVVMADNEEPFLVRVNMQAYTSGTCNANLTTDPFYQEGIVKITAVAVGGVTATADIQRTCGSTATTADWAEGSWSDYRGWPSVVEFHPEDRLMFANTETEPDTYWLTQAGNYISFWRNSPLLDSDAISSPVPSRKVNGINGLVPLSEMIALTLSNEISIRSSSGPITPTSTLNKIHGWEGSYGVRPLIIGNRALYVQSTGSIIRDLGFDLYSDSFAGLDRSILSNHLFNGYTITEMAYQQNPDRLVWAIRSDGILLSMTFLPEQEVIAWTWHNTNAGTDLFESVCSIRGTGFDEVWFSVNRGGTRYIERMVQRQASTAPADQFFVDCGTTTSTGQLSMVTGLTQLNGKTVAILADGNVLSQQAVSGSSVNLGATYSTVQVGLPYTSDIETLNVDATLQDGTTQGRKIKISKLVLRFLNSRGGKLGPDSDTLYNIQHPTQATSLVLFSTDVKETMAGGYSDGGRIFIRQSDPLPLTLLAVIPTITVGGMTSE